VQVHEYSGEELEQVASENLMPVLVRTEPQFRGRMAMADLGGAVALTSAHSAGSLQTVYTDRMAARADAGDRMVFCVHVSGRGHVRQHDRVAELTTGTGVLYEARSRWELVAPGENRHLALHFSRDLLPLPAARVSEACARGLDPRTPAMQMLSGYLGRLFELGDTLTGEQRLDAGRAAVDLLVMALRDVGPAVTAADGSAAVLLDMMRLHVREHLADPRLDVEELARRHHVSVRHTHTLFARAGTTPGAYLREQRLLAAQAMLADPRHDLLPVAAIAATTGFGDPRTFERAFRRRYGTTPGSWRFERSAVPEPAVPEPAVPEPPDGRARGDVPGRDRR
jgi:AraC-like DNA-binding protein